LGLLLNPHLRSKQILWFVSLTIEEEWDFKTSIP